MLSNTGGGETTTTTTTTSNTNTNGVVVSGGGGADIYAALSGLMANGIEVDKNLRQPTFYSWITFDELRIESFWIITDLLGNQKIPYWLSQRIAWYYSNKFFNEILQDLSLSSEKCENEAKTFNREKLVIYLRKGISKVIKEWLNEKSRLINQNIKSLVFSFSRTSCDFIKPMIYYEYGLKNKRRIMEDKTACYENIDILSSHRLFDLKRTSDSENESDDDVENDHDVELTRRRRRPNSLFAVFDGHCGADCAQYVSTHLPMAIADSLTADAELPVEDMFKSTFQRVNDKFTEKAKEESLRSGTTACVCLLNTSSSHQNYVHVAWCGDTQCMIVKENGHISFMSAAHKPSSEAEKRRIESCGGTVTYQSSAWRVNGALAVARAFGDLDYQASGVTCLPECTSIALDGTEQFLIIGCDGLWEGLLGTDSSNDSSDNPDEVINRDDWLAGLYDELRQRSNSNPAEFLVRRAKDNGSSDNITAVLVCLKENGLMHSASCSKPTESNILHL